MRIGIYGYGNLGRGVECAAYVAEDCELVGIFTRRDPKTVSSAFGTAVYSSEELSSMADSIDVLILCGGSATDLPEMTPELAEKFSVVDSFDTHKEIPAHFARVDAAARAGGRLALISSGWDPGLFSVARAYASAVIPNGCDYTFWGRGISQGHSDAIRRIDGVLDARQYTIPVESALRRVRGGECPTLSAREKHKRDCYVVAREGADLARIEREIKEMPNYFADYDTTVTFITEEELLREHSGMPHGGSVIRNGVTGRNAEHTHTVEFSLSLDSNPEFTGSVLLAYARAVYRMRKRGEVGCITVFDVPPVMLSPLSREEMIKSML
ncbi:MAG: diaminopimelate dehydrogenase [Clostridia bacterium]|nr:diaminopimelate dehydrogenase [Clostridia bacterium]